MRIQLDTENKTITLLEDVIFQELFDRMNEYGFQFYEWKIKGNTFRVPTEDKSSFRDFTNLPNTQNPYMIPNYPPYTGDPILWCGKGTTQGINVGLGGMLTTTDTANIDKTEIGNDYDIDNKTHKYAPK